MSVERPIPAPLDHPVRLAVLVSGGGTTLQNLIDKIRQGLLDANICLVVSAKAQCGAIEKARRAGIHCEVVPRLDFGNVAEFSSAVFDLCRQAAAELVVLGGFLSLLRIPDDFRFRVFNIHPALIPSFCGQGYYGDKVHAAALKRGVKISGCTVHFADNAYDHGPIILQRTVPVQDDDTAESLQARVFLEECEVLPAAIRLFAAGRITIADGRVFLEAGILCALPPPAASL